MTTSQILILSIISLAVLYNFIERVEKAWESWIYFSHFICAWCSILAIILVWILVIDNNKLQQKQEPTKYEQINYPVYKLK